MNDTEKSETSDRAGRLVSERSKRLCAAPSPLGCALTHQPRAYAQGDPGGGASRLTVHQVCNPEVFALMSQRRRRGTSVAPAVRRVSNGWPKGKRQRRVLYQPGATPRETKCSSTKGLKARPILHYGAGFQPFRPQGIRIPGALPQAGMARAFSPQPIQPLDSLVRPRLTASLNYERRRCGTCRLPRLKNLVSPPAQPGFSLLLL